MTNREIHRSYEELLKTPEWHEFADGVKARKGGVCQICAELERKVEVHHLGYRDVLPWEYEDHELLLVCRECHGNIHYHADQMWNEALKVKNQWAIYECMKAVQAVLRSAEPQPKETVLWRR